ncbi:MAG: cell division protein FtsI (penicillin-binding protein 3) [Chitinophagales bacterium]|jgi:cell division protein FtsI (penicillin-binding protein 3)
MSTNKRQEIMWRMWVAILVPVLAGFAIVFQSFKIQVYEGPALRQLADSLTIVSRSIEAERGNIYAEDGSLLSTSLPFFEIRMDFKSEPMTDNIFNRNIDSLAYMLSVNIGAKSKADYKNELIANRQKGNRYYLIKRNVTYPELKKIYDWPFFRLGRYKSGMIVLQKNKRITPFGILAERTIGFKRIVPNPSIENRMDTIRVGIEGKFDEYLAGVEGQMLMQRISGGVYIPLNGQGNIEPKAGNDVKMTIDINIQDVTESALKKALLSSNADNGCAVVMEVKTGKIKAIANLTYRKELGRYIEYYNYAVGANTEPGSTFKLMAMAALLEDGLLKDVNAETVDVEGGVKKYADRIMRDVHVFNHDTITVKEAFAYSSNVGISKLVTERYGDKASKFYDRLIAMHLQNPVGIEITGETAPTIHPPSSWSQVSLPWMSTGYEVQMSPLQILTFYNAIANDGKMMKPYLVSAIKDLDEVVEQFDPIVIDKAVVSSSTVHQLQKLLEGVFEIGSARHLKSGGQLTMAGKTGTARIANATTQYQDKIYQASFAGYFPADNPLYSCIVVINNPKNGYYGGAVAGPVFAEIANKIYANGIEMHNSIQSNPLVSDYTIPRIGNLQSGEAEIIYNKLGFSFHSDINSDYGIAKKENNAMTMKANNVIDGLVPNLIEMDLKDALFVAENAGLRVQVYGSGKVKKQSLTAGGNFTQGQTITVELF